MKSDVTRCANRILADLPVARPASFADLMHLCDIRGGRPLVDRSMTTAQGGKCVDGEIVIAPGCSIEEYREIIPHELVHRLADTPRWETLNYRIADRTRTRCEFLEAVATAVGRSIRNAEQTTEREHD